VASQSEVVICRYILSKAVVQGKNCMYIAIKIWDVMKNHQQLVIPNPDVVSLFEKSAQPE
jgi:hypothetical protein